MNQVRQGVVAPRQQDGRLAGVDLARGIAILAMVVAHVKHWAQVPEGTPASVVLGQVNNLASPFFGLLMGVALGLVMNRQALGPGDRRAIVVQNVVRGALLVIIGMALTSLSTFIAIVLQVLGVVLAVGTPIAVLGPWVSGVVAGVLFLVGPSINAAARAVSDPMRPWQGDLGSQVLQWVVLSPSYRLTNLLPLFLAGVVLARLGLTRRVVLGVLAVGAPVYVVSGMIRARDEGIVVSGSLLDNFCDLGLSFTAFGSAMLVARAMADRAWLRRPLVPVVAIGTLPLTVYVVHVLLVASFMRTMGQDAYVRWPLPATVVLVGTVAFAWAWWRWVGKGPVEVLMGVVSGRYSLRQG